ncbi:hypothetical protein DB346_07760 [Verrucomicrobia bacterium LW23]|nr:hypothetical protein DB346_07760 [Verrucomicrobia bacterium LW23]
MQPPVRAEVIRQLRTTASEVIAASCGPIAPQAGLRWSFRREEVKTIGWTDKFAPNATRKLKIPLVHRNVVTTLLEWLVYSQWQQTPGLQLRQQQLALDTAETAHAIWAEKYISPAGCDKERDLTDSDGAIWAWTHHFTLGNFARLSDDQVRQKWDMDYWQWRPTIYAEPDSESGASPPP